MSFFTKWLRSNFDKVVESGKSHFSRKSGKPKIKYCSLGEAQLKAKEMKNKTGKKFYAYRCPYCFGFHIGGSK